MTEKKKKKNYTSDTIVNYIYNVFKHDLEKCLIFEAQFKGHADFSFC